MKRNNSPPKKRFKQLDLFEKTLLQEIEEGYLTDITNTKKDGKYISNGETELTKDQYTGPQSRLQDEP